MCMFLCAAVFFDAKRAQEKKNKAWEGKWEKSEEGSEQ